jgi:P27 family predicted phage terminase small subunit
MRGDYFWLARRTPLIQVKGFILCFVTRRRVPIEQKRLHGRGPGKDCAGNALPAPVVVLPAPAEIPAPPEILCESGRRHWRRIWTQARAWLCEVDAGAAERYCQLFDWRDVMLEQVVKQGFTVKGSTGQRVPHPLLQRIEATNAELRLLEGRLGLDPSARAALGVAEVRRASALDAMMARQREG